MHITERLHLLRNAMLRNDLDDTQRRIYWLLLIERTNAETGLCCCSNQHIAEQLHLDIRTVDRAKQRLKKNGLLAWTPGAHAGVRASLYRFYKGLPGTGAGVQSMNTPGSPRQQRRGTTPAATPGFIHRRTEHESEELARNRLTAADADFQAFLKGIRR